MKDIYGFDVNYVSGVNYIIGRLSALLFVFIAGISCTLSRNSAARGFRVLALAMLLTVATHLYDPMFGIKFGILHFLGTSMLLYPLFKKLDSRLLVVLGTIFALLYFVTSNITPDADYFFIIGIRSNYFDSADYYPLIPWLGVFLYGIAAGKTVYGSRKSIFRFNPGDSVISMAGRHTLLLYMVHQPVILLILLLITRLL